MAYCTNLKPAWSSDSLRLSCPSGNSCGLVKNRSLSRGCKAHFHPSKGPCLGCTGICLPLADPSPSPPHQILHWSSFPEGRARGTGWWIWSWSGSASVGSGSSACESMGRTRRYLWWSHGWLESAPLCSSRCKCWPPERPRIRPQWKREPRSRRTSRSYIGSSCPRLSCHWDLQHYWRCKQWYRWCCLGLRRWDKMKWERDEGHNKNIFQDITAECQEEEASAAGGDLKYPCGR